MSIDFEWLENHVFHRKLTEGEKVDLDQMIHVVRFPAGSRIVVQGDAGGGVLYILRSGSVEVVMDFNGETIHIADLRAGSQVGDMTFLDEENANTTILAKEDCVAYKISRKDLANLLVFRQGIACDLIFNTLTNMAREIRELNLSNAAAMGYIQGRRV